MTQNLNPFSTFEVNVLVHARIVLCSVSAWSETGNLFKVDLSALKPYAQQCLSRYIHIYSLSGENIMAREKEICRLELDSVDPKELMEITVCFYL
jgi:hypothetical protein